MTVCQHQSEKIINDVGEQKSAILQQWKNTSCIPGHTSWWKNGALIISLQWLGMISLSLSLYIYIYIDFTGEQPETANSWYALFPWAISKVQVELVCETSKQHIYIYSKLCFLNLILYIISYKKIYTYIIINYLIHINNKQLGSWVLFTPPEQSPPNLPPNSKKLLPGLKISLLPAEVKIPNKFFLGILGRAHSITMVA